MRFRQSAFSFISSAIVGVWLGHATTTWRRVSCVVLCVGVVCGLAWQAAEWQMQHQRLTERRESVARQLAQLEPRKPVAKVSVMPLSAHVVTRYNLAVRLLNTPWSDVFDGLERQAQADIGLTLLEPDIEQGKLRVQAEAKHIDTLIIYAQRLAADSAFGSLTLTQHETNEQDVNRPARLSFDVQVHSFGGATR